MHVCGHSAEQPLLSDEIVALSLPWSENVFRMFGPERIMFESNFPMDKASFSYVSYWNAAKKMSIRLSKDPNVRRKLLFENANRLYRLGLPVPNADLYHFGLVSSRL